MSKYDPLSMFLRNTTTSSIVLSKKQIEQILGFALPHSASVYREWWANDSSHVQAKSWLNAGWKIENVIIENNITFKKTL